MAHEAEILQAIEKVSKKIDLTLTLLQSRPQGDLKDLHAALALAQTEYTTARPSRENKYYKLKYEALEDVINASRPYLAKNGLSVKFTQTVLVDGGSLLTCILAHSSGQQIESSVRITAPKNDPRSVMSEVEYLKRMLYTGITGVCAGDDDDDAEELTNLHRKEKGDITEEIIKPLARDNSRDTISKEQLDELQYELNGHPDIAELLLDQLNLNYLSDMPKSAYRTTMDRLKAIKQRRTKAK